MIDEYELYHGAVFSILLKKRKIEIEPYKSNNKCSYILGGKNGIFIKHSVKRRSPWYFSFSKNHQDDIKDMNQKLNKVFLLLVCGKDGIVCLSFNELKNVLDENYLESESIGIHRNKRQKYLVKGTDGKLRYKIGINEFPNKILK